MTLASTINFVVRSLALLAAASLAQAASVSFTGPLTNNGSNSSCKYSAIAEDAAGNWTVTCSAAGANTITVTPALCSMTCTSYSSISATAAGAWSVNGCVGTTAGVNLTQPAAPIANQPLNTVLRLKATATACTGTITKVEFLANGTLIPNSAVTTPPYEFDWLPTVAGNHGIQARATDSTNGVTPSQTVNVYVNAPPSVSLSVTSPGTAASPPGARAAPATYVLSATASDPNGIDRIEFWNGSTNVGSFNGTSAQVTLTNLAAGNYSVFARTYDALGSPADSVPVALVVTATNQLPAVSFSAPAAGASTGKPVNLEVSVNDNDGQVVRVDYYNAETGTLLGSSTTPANNFRYTWAAPANGARRVYARAFDNSSVLTNTFTQSAERAFTVVEPFRLLLSTSGSYPYIGSADLQFTVMGWDIPGVPMSSMKLYRDGVFAGDLSMSGTTWRASVNGLGPGTHRFKALAIATNGVNGESNEAVVVVESSAPPAAPQVCSANSEQVSGTIPGSIAGSGGVGEMGASTYSIPIQVSPGIAGMAPSLSLGYNSQGGNGLLGQGWSLQGLSVIHRCPKTPFTEGKKVPVGYIDPANANVPATYQRWDLADGLCMDGQKLIPLTVGDRNQRVEYRTERESYSKIESFNFFPGLWNGPAHFKVQTKGGQILYYGFKTTEVDNPYAAPQDAVLRTWPQHGFDGRESGRVWALYRIEDRKGNNLVITYDTSNDNLSTAGTQRPSYIDYTRRGTSPAFARVAFTYEPRPDAVQSFDSGGQRGYEDQRLKAITASVDQQAFKTYTLSYGVSAATGRSLLTSVTECSGNGNPSFELCLTPTQFTWSDQAGGAMNLQGAGSTSFTLLPSEGDRHVADMNGDGKSDLIAYEGQQTNRWIVCLSGLLPCQTWTGTHNNGVVFGDFNGDGKTDQARWISGAYLVCLSTGNSFTCNNWPASQGSTVNVTAGDFDGDGRIDIISYDTNNFWNVCLSRSGTFDCHRVLGPEQGPTGGLFSTTVGDFNGDGRADLAGKKQNDLWQVCMSVFNVNANNATIAAGFDCKATNSHGPSQFAYHNHVADFNGDGIADLLGYRGGSQWDVCISRADGTFDCGIWTGHDDDDGNRVGDFNGDGRTDIAKFVRMDPGPVYIWRVCLSTGTGFTCTDKAGPGRPDGQTRQNSEFVGDYNGDGKSDIGIFNDSQFVLGMSAYPDVGLVSNIRNGLGADIAYSYQPLTNPAYYEKGTGAVFPEIDLQSPLYVVTLMRTSTLAANPWYDTGYSYRGMKGDTRGAGTGGFTGRAVVNMQTSTCTESETLTNWNERLIGVPLTVTQRYASAGSRGRCSGFSNELSVTTNTWVSRKSNSFGGSTNFWSQPSVDYPIYEAFLAKSVESRWDFNERDNVRTATLTSTSRASANEPFTVNDPDVMGNARVTVSSSSDGYSKSTSNIFLNDLSGWILGRVTRSTATSTLPYSPVNNNGLTSRSRVTAFEYEPGTGMMTAETVEPDAGSSSAEYLRTTYGLDAFGNRETVTTSGLGVPSRTKTSKYCANGNDGAFCSVNGRFATLEINPIGQSEVRQFDSRFGGIKVLRGPNGLETTGFFDKMTRKFCERRADGSTSGSAWRLPAFGEPGVFVVSTFDSTGLGADGFVDALNREVMARKKAFASGTYSTVTTTYDSLLRKAKITKPYADTDGDSTYNYDFLNRVVQESAPLGYLARYDYYGLRSVVTLSGNDVATAQRTEKTINSRGEVVKVVDALNSTLLLQHEHFGNLEKTSALPGNNGCAYALTGAGECGTPTVIRYNVRGHKTSMSDPDMGNRTYVVDALGETTQQTDANSEVLSFAYDNLGRMIRRTESSTTTNWHYDTVNGAPCGVRSAGKLCRVDKGSGAVVRDYKYDNLARPTGIKLSVSDGSVFERFMAYDSMSRVRQVVYPFTNIAMNTEYDGTNGFVTRIVEAATGTVHWRASSRYRDGQINTQDVRGSSIFRTYDLLGRPATIKMPAVQDAYYKFDALGNLVTRRDDAAGLTTETFTHDALNRVRSVARAGTPGTSYTYDSLGNLTARSDSGALTYNPGTHQVATHAGETFRYDPVGNQVGTTGLVGFGAAYSTSGMPMLVQKLPASGPRQGYNFTYDGDNQRVLEIRTVDNSASGKTWTFSDGNTPFFEEEHEFPADGSTRIIKFKHYVMTPEGIQELIVVKNDPAQTRTEVIFARDHLGSTVTVAGGVPSQQLGYDAWGKRRDANGTPNPNAASPTTDRGFTGHEMLDAVGFIHMNARIYSPGMGRFLQPDQLVQAAFDLQAFNRYSYARNNPLAYIDPSGYSWWTSQGRSVFRMVAAAVASYFTAGWASGLYSNYAVLAIADGAVPFAIGGSVTVTTSVVGGAAGGFAAGGIMGGNLKSAMYGAISGGAGGWLGSMGLDPIVQKAGEAAVAGAISAAQGKGFGKGASPYVAFYLVSEVLNFATPPLEVKQVANFGLPEQTIIDVTRIEKGGVAGINGILNDVREAMASLAAFSGARDFTLVYNPTRSFLQDGIETFQDTFGGGSKASRQLRALLQDAESRGLTLDFYAHSQGGAITASALAGTNIKTLPTYVGAPVSRSLAVDALHWRANSNDLVPMVLGGNGNLLQMLNSIVNSPRLFMGCAYSTHSRCAYAK